MVYIGLFIEYPTPFLREYFEKIQKITYPKQRLGIFIHNQVRTPRIEKDILSFSRLSIIKILRSNILKNSKQMNTNS
jgi:hypothetical protein